MTSSPAESCAPLGDDRRLVEVPAALTQALMERERLLHAPESDPDPAAFRARVEAGMIDGYWEVGASGGVFDTTVILDVLGRRATGELSPAGPWVTRDESCRLLAPRTYLLTYELVQGERRTRRVTLWRGAGEDWVAAYHQGTVITGEW